MSDENEIPLPDLCKNCTVYLSGPIRVHTKCDFCNEYAFHENVLCDLIRITQKEKTFECDCFQPQLAMIDSSGHTHYQQSKNRIKGKSIDEIIAAYSISRPEWFTEKAVEEYLNDRRSLVWLRCHFVFVTNRRNNFFHAEHHFHKLFALLQECGPEIGGRVFLLWLSSDHVHLLVEPDEHHSLETVATLLKEKSSTKKFDFIHPHGEEELWNEEYFVESVSTLSFP